MSSLLKERPLKFSLHVFIWNDGTGIRWDQAASTESSGHDKIAASLFCKHHHLLFWSFFSFFNEKRKGKKKKIGCGDVKDEAIHKDSVLQNKQRKKSNRRTEERLNCV